MRNAVSSVIVSNRTTLHHVNKQRSSGKVFKNKQNRNNTLPIVAKKKKKGCKMGTITYHVVLYIHRKRPYNKVLDTLSLSIVKVRGKLVQLPLSFLEYYLGRAAPLLSWLKRLSSRILFRY